MQVHFHEVGAIDSIIDIVGTCAALDLLGVDAVYASPVAVGRGMVRSAHGLIPNPPPAVVELLHDAPTYGIDTTVELTTPTGAALLAANVIGWGALPPMTIGASGFGAGPRDIDGRVNAVQIVVGAPAATLGRGQPATLFEIGRCVRIFGVAIPRLGSRFACSINSRTERRPSPITRACTRSAHATTLPFTTSTRWSLPGRTAR